MKSVVLIVFRTVLGALGLLVLARTIVQWPASVLDAVFQLSVAVVLIGSAVGGDRAARFLLHALFAARPGEEHSPGHLPYRVVIPVLVVVLVVAVVLLVVAIP